jgi:hypothetical protein
VELAFVPLEHGVDDLPHLELHALPEVLRGEGAHLHQHLALPLALGDGLDRGFVFLDRDLALAEQDLAQAVVGQVRRSEHDAAVLQVERLARPTRDEGEDARGLRQAEMLEDFGDGQLGDLALQTARNHERLEALRKSRCHQELV